MQQIENTFVPLYIESNLQTCDFFNPSSIVINEFACEPVDEVYLCKQMELYCMCDINLSCVCDVNQFGLNQMVWPYIQEDQLNMNFANFKSKVQLYDERIVRLWSLLDQVFDCESIIVKQAKKIQRKCRSQRRSAYIGVSKNGPNWQAMISVEKRKSYIGTYVSELEAAQAFDFYSLLIHGFSAKTNFSYSKSDIINLINRFQTFTQ